MLATVRSLRGTTPPLALKKILYFLPTLAGGSGFFVIRRCAATVNGTSSVVLSPSVSVTTSLTEVFPGTVGLPLIAPVAGSIVSPSGSAAPAPSDQAYVPLPPVACGAASKARPTSPTAVTGPI